MEFREIMFQNRWLVIPKWGNIRVSIPHFSVSLWIEQSFLTLDQFIEKITALYRRKIPYSPIGIRFIERNEKRLPELHIEDRYEIKQISTVLINEQTPGKKLKRRLQLSENNILQ